MGARTETGVATADAEQAEKQLIGRCKAALVYLCLINQLQGLIKQASSSEPPAASAVWTRMFHPAFGLQARGQAGAGSGTGEGGDVGRMDELVLEWSAEIHRYFDHDLVQAAAERQPLLAFFTQLGVVDEIRALGHGKGQEVAFVRSVWGEGDM